MNMPSHIVRFCPAFSLWMEAAFAQSSSFFAFARHAQAERYKLLAMEAAKMPSPQIGHTSMCSLFSMRL